MEPTKYIDLIAKTVDEIKSESFKLKNDEADIALQQAILAARKDIHSIEQQLISEKKSFPFIPDNVITIANRLELAQRKLKQLEALKEELF